MQNKNSRTRKVKTHDEFSIFNSTVCILDTDTQQDRTEERLASRYPVPTAGLVVVV